MPLFAAIDLGGTKIYTVLGNEKGLVLHRVTIKTLAGSGPEYVINQMVQSVRDVLAVSPYKPEDLDGVGVCAAGFFNWKKRLLVHSPNLSGWCNVDLEKELAGHFGLPVLAENDANAAAFGEARSGAGRGRREMIYITVSTGIGAGLILNGGIYRGASGFAGEAGHMVVKNDGPLCGCGRSGCLETIASGTALARAANEAVSLGRKTYLSELSAGGRKKLTSRDVFTAAEAGDETAKEILAEATHYLGVALVNLVNVMNPEAIVIGGGVAEAGDVLLAPLREAITAKAIPAAASDVVLLKAQLGVEAGVIGMLHLLSEY